MPLMTIKRGQIIVSSCDQSRLIIEKDQLISALICSGQSRLISSGDEVEATQLLLGYAELQSRLDVQRQQVTDVQLWPDRSREERASERVEFAERT